MKEAQTGCEQKGACYSFLMKMSREWIDTDCGRLILLPESLTPHWKGVEDEENPTSSGDYGRACAVSDFLEKIPVSDGWGLVMGDTPDMVTDIMTELGPSLLRWRCADSETAMLESVARNLRRATVVGKLDYLTSEAGHLLFGSGLAGIEFDEALAFRLEPARYTVSTRLHAEDSTEFLIHVFEKR